MSGSAVVTPDDNPATDPAAPVAAKPRLAAGRMAVIAFGLAATTLLVFGRTAWERFDFVRYDDHQYVTDNELVSRGLTWEGIAWVFRPDAVVVSNWHPLTMLSHMVDCQLFGLDAWGHHLTSVLWHTANVVLLFLVLARMTNALWPSALTAALFAWHPLHVESVAWIAERKDVLSTFCWLMLIWAYVSYVKRPRWWSYLPLLAWLGLGLLAKPMLVTAPATLLLLDYWPLGRFRLPAGRESMAPLGRLLLEKLPLFALAIAFCVITLGAQSKAKMPWEVYPLGTRLPNALQSYVAYLGQTVWPANLAIPYLLSGRVITPVRGLLSALAIVLATTGAIAFRRKHPYLPVGWLWYLGTLVPVIGLVQVGVQAMADRYTYVPLIGIFVIVAWGLADLVRAVPRLKPVIVGSVLAWLAVLIALSYQQVGFWRNKITLFGHTAAVIERNHVARMYLGTALAAAGRTDEALVELDRAIELSPNLYKPQLSKGLLLYKAGRYGQAAAALAKTVRLSQGRMRPEVEAAIAVLSARVAATHPEESERNAASAIEMAEHGCAMTGYQYPEALDALGMAYANAGRFPQAIARANQAREIYRAGNAAQLAAEVGGRIELYQQQMPYREQPASEPGVSMSRADE